MDHKEVVPRGRGIYLLPNLFTITALFAGFYAIVVAMANRFDDAAIAIFVAMVMDALDGRVARLTNTQTAFGAQLDSLSDMVSFGIAPALVIYHWGLDSLGKIGWLAAFVYAAAGALRLARFNVQIGTVDKRYFIGLSITASAGLMAGIIWVCNKYGVNGHEPIASSIAALITVLIGVLMVSRLRYYSFKDINLKDKLPFIAVLLIVIILVLFALDPPEMLLFTFALYALSGPCLWIWRRYRLRRSKKARANKISSIK